MILVDKINPALGFLFAVVIFVGIYTSAVPLLWTSICRVSNEKTNYFKFFTIAGGVLGCVIACVVPYAPLLNVMYGLNGYLGFTLMAFMIVHDVRAFIKSRKKSMNIR